METQPCRGQRQNHQDMVHPALHGGESHEEEVAARVRRSCQVSRNKPQRSPAAGPDMLTSLTAVLMNFRLHAFAFDGDIREIVHQVGEKESDQCTQRFLWRNLDTTRPPEVYVVKIMTFAAVSSPTTAQYIQNRNARGMEQNTRKRYERSTTSIMSTTILTAPRRRMPPSSVPLR